MVNPEQNIDQPKIIDKKVEALLDSSDIAVDPESGLAIAVIKPEAFRNRDQIIRRLEAEGLHIEKTVQRKLPAHFVVGKMYKDLPLGIEVETLKQFNSGMSEIILVKGGPDVSKKLVAATGLQTDPNKCEKGTIRYMFGKHYAIDAGDGKKFYPNAIHRGKPDEDGKPSERKEDLDKFRSFF